MQRVNFDRKHLAFWAAKWCMDFHTHSCMMDHSDADIVCEFCETDKSFSELRENCYDIIGLLIRQSDLRPLFHLLQYIELHGGA